MARTIGWGRYRTETYPTARAESAAPPQPSFEFDQNTDAYEVADGDDPLTIATATINLTAGSRVKVEGLACFAGADAIGRAILTSPTIAGVNAIQSFGDGTDTDDNFSTCNYLGVTDVQPAGPLTIGLQIQVSGGDGSTINNAGATVLTLTEIPAT